MVKFVFWMWVVGLIRSPGQLVSMRARCRALILHDLFLVSLAIQETMSLMK